MADRVTFVPPRDPWPFSTVTADDLEALVAEGLLCPLSGDSQPEWMAPPSGAAPSSPSGYVVSFVSFHERRFCMSTGWSCTTSVLTPSRKVCEGYLGIDPH
jgi:hypothetical protein